MASFILREILVLLVSAAYRGEYIKITLMKKFLVFVLLVCSSSIYAQVNLTQGLVLYLPFNGNANDASGNGNNATVVGATLTTDQAGNPNSAYSFNGTSDYMYIVPDSSQLVSSFSICAQVLPDTFYTGPCGLNTVFSKGTHKTISNIGLSYGARPGRTCSNPYNPSNVIFLDYLGDHYIDELNTTGLAPQNFINPNQWYCAVATYDSASHRYRLYVDGVKHIDTVFSPPHLFTATANDSIFIARLNDANFPYWVNGKLDEIRLYNRAINDQEVAALCGPLSCDTLAHFTYSNACQLFNFLDSSYANCTQIAQWDWDFGDGTSSTLQNPAHMYPVGPASWNVTLKITDTAGVLLDSVSYTVNVPAPPSIVASPDTTICAGDSVQLSATAGPNVTIYTWINSGGSLSDTSIANPIATPVNTTTYTVVGYDDVTQCTDTAQVSVTVINPNLNILSSAFGTTCADDTVTLSVPAGFTSYSWTPTAAVTSTNTPSTQAIGNAASITYFVSVQDTNGCFFTDSQIVNKYAAPTGEIVHTLINCAEIQFALNNLGGGSANSWTWDFGDGNTATGQSPSHTYLNNGTFVVTATGDYGNGCQVVFYDTVQMSTANINITATPAYALICPGDTVQINTTGASNVLWVGNTVGLSNTTATNPTATPNTSTIYTVTTNFGNGCIDTAEVELEVIADAVRIQGDFRSCQGETIELNIAPVGTTVIQSLSWNPAIYCSNPTGSTTNVGLPSTGYVSVAATTVNGCVVWDSVLIEVSPVPNFGISMLTSPPCKSNPIQFEATGGGDYSWEPNQNFDNPFIANPIYTNTNDATVSVTITGGCKDSTLRMTADLVNDNRDVYVWVNDSTTGCFNTSVFLNARGADSYRWEPHEYVIGPDSSVTRVEVSGTQEFTLTATDEFGCKYYDTVEVEFSQGEKFYMPNAFSPHDPNGLDRVYKIMNFYEFHLLEFSIFNRWGQKIWTTSDIEEGWDGKYEDGTYGNQENYVWLIRADTPCGSFEKTGTVLLME